MQKNRLGVQLHALLVLLILLIAASMAVAGDQPAIAQGGGFVDLPPAGDFQVHHHTFGFVLLGGENGLELQLQYHDHHEGAASVPIHDEASAFGIHMTSVRPRTFNRGPNWIYFGGPAIKRTVTQGENPGPVREYVCVWAEDGGGVAPDRFHLETEPRGFVPGYTSGGAYLGCSRTEPPLTPVLPFDDGYVVGGGNITILPPR